MDNILLLLFVLLTGTTMTAQALSYSRYFIRPTELNVTLEHVGGSLTLCAALCRSERATLCQGFQYLPGNEKDCRLVDVIGVELQTVKDAVFDTEIYTNKGLLFGGKTVAV